jgi:hypothetical protein
MDGLDCVGHSFALCTHCSFISFYRCLDLKPKDHSLLVLPNPYPLNPVPDQGFIFIVIIEIFFLGSGKDFNFFFVGLMIFLDPNLDSEIVSTDLIESGSNLDPDPETVLSTELAAHDFHQIFFFETLPLVSLH